MEDTSPAKPSPCKPTLTIAARAPLSEPLSVLIAHISSNTSSLVTVSTMSAVIHFFEGRLTGQDWSKTEIDADETAESACYP